MIKLKDIPKYFACPFCKGEMYIHYRFNDCYRLRCFEHENINYDTYSINFNYLPQRYTDPIYVTLDLIKINDYKIIREFYDNRMPEFITIISSKGLYFSLEPSYFVPDYTNLNVDELYQQITTLIAFQ